jgi:hypothetical protein
MRMRIQRSMHRLRDPEAVGTWVRRRGAWAAAAAVALSVAGCGTYTADAEIPGWLPHEPGARRVVAENEGVKLVVAREGDDRMSVALGGSVGLTESIDSWRRRLAGDAVVVLGPGSFPGGRPLDRLGRRPLLGLVADGVDRVELRYRSGGSVSQDELDGGFVLIVEADEPLREIAGFDKAGHVVGRVDVTELDLGVCADVRGCPPGDR